MIRRAQLYRKQGSPLISGRLRPRSVNWGWVVAVLVVVAVVGAAVWYVRFR